MSKVAKKKGTSSAVAPIVLRPKLDNFKGKLDEGATSIENNGKIYDFRMDAREFQPADVILTIKEKCISIDAHHETEEEETEISFEIEIPIGVDRTLIEAHMNKHGVLKISAPITLEMPLPVSKTVLVRSEHKTETVAKQLVTTRVVEEIVQTSFWEEDPPTLDPKFEDVSNCIERSESGEGFKLNLDLPPGTSKEDVHVNVYKTLATVEVKPKVQEPGKLQVEICKKVVLPKQTRNKTLTSVMDVQNGRFTITGLLKTPEREKRKEPEKVFEIKKVPPKGVPTGQVPVTVKSNEVLSVDEIKKAEDLTDEVNKSVAIGGNKFETKINVNGWNTNEVEVKVLKKVVTIRAQREESSLFKLFTIPPRVRHEDLQAEMDNGQLRVYSELQQMCPLPTKILDTGIQTRTSKDAGVLEEYKNFKHALDLSGYEPEQIEICIKNGWISIKAKQVKGVRFIHNFQARQFSRKFTIPTGIDPGDVVCQLDPVTSTLFVTAKID